MKTRTRIGALLVAVLMGIGGAAVLPSPAFAATYGPFRVRNYNGYCLKSPYQDGNGLVWTLTSCGGQYNYDQMFYFKDAGDPLDYPFQYHVISNVNGYCMMPFGQNPGDGVVQGYCATGVGLNPWFIFYTNSAGSGIALTNKATGYSLRAPSGTTGPTLDDFYFNSSIWYLDSVY